MNTHFQKVALRFAAVSGLLVGGSVVACSSTTDPVAPPPAPSGGSGGSGAAAGGTGGTGGSATGGGGASAGGTGGGSGCPAGQQMIMGACACPTFNPDYCEAAGKCVNFTKNPDFCGACTTACGATQACSAGACTAELTTVADVTGCGTLKLVYANATLYALSTMTGQLSSVPVAGGAPVAIGTPLTGASAFAVDATSAYVVNGMKVTKVVLAGGAKTDLVTETTPIYDVAVDATSIYYATDKDATDTSADHMDFGGFVKKASNTTAGAGVIVGGGMDVGQPQGVAVSGANVLYASNSAMNTEVQKGLPVLADAHTDPNHYKLGASQGSLFFGHRSVQVDGTYVYWANGSLQRSAFGETAPVQEQVATPIGIIGAYAIDGASSTAYFASDTGDLEKSAFKAMAGTPLARKLETVTSIVTDPTSVYVAAGCKILKSPL